MKAKKFALYFDSFVLCQKRKYVKLLVVGFYALLCAPTYKNVGFNLDPPQPESSNPTKKAVAKKGYLHQHMWVLVQNKKLPIIPKFPPW
jgi:hypothetical protein